MKTLCICALIALTCLLTLSEAAVSLGPAEVDPAYPNKCAWKDPKTKFQSYHAINTSWKSGNCGKATCKKIDGRLMLENESCGVIGVRPPCTLTPINPAKNYPQCCPKESCPPKN